VGKVINRNIRRMPVNMTIYYIAIHAVAVLGWGRGTPYPVLSQAPTLVATHEVLQPESFN